MKKRLAQGVYRTLTAQLTHVLLCETKENLKPVHQSAGNIVIVLASLPGVYVDWWDAAPVVTSFHADFPPLYTTARNVDIQSHSALQHTSGVAAIAGVLAEEEQIAAGLEMSDSAAEAYPWREV